MALKDADAYADLLWLDIEASGLQAGSYPIEVGWCRIDLVPVNFLIRPLAAWGIENWSAASEKIHGISRRHLLEFGQAAEDVAHWLNAASRGKTVLSDNPVHDATWLRQLYRGTAVAQEFDLLDAADAAAGLSGLSQPEAEELLERIHRRYPHPHRAGPDARRSAAEFLVRALPHHLQEIEAMA